LNGVIGDCRNDGLRQPSVELGFSEAESEARVRGQSQSQRPESEVRVRVRVRVSGVLDFAV